MYIFGLEVDAEHLSKTPRAQQKLNQEGCGGPCNPEELIISITEPLKQTFPMQINALCEIALSLLWIRMLYLSWRYCELFSIAPSLSVISFLNET